MTIRAHTHPNPWGLTDIEYLTLQAYVKEGSSGKASIALGCTVRSIENAMRRARDRMGVRTTPLMVGQWVKWRAQQEQPVRTSAHSVDLCATCQGLGFVRKVAA